MAAPGTASAKGTLSKQDSAPPAHRQPDLWGIILTESGRRDVRMKDDTGTPVNWIHPDLARRFKLKLEQCDSQRFEDFNGKKFKAEHVVWFTWLGRRKDNDCTYYGKFYVAPELSSIDVVLGEEFVHKNGFARDICHLQQHTRPSRIFTSSKQSKKEKEQINANREKSNREAEALAEAREKKQAEAREKKKRQTKQEANKG